MNHQTVREFHITPLSLPTNIFHLHMSIEHYHQHSLNNKYLFSHDPRIQICSQDRSFFQCYFILELRDYHIQLTLTTKCMK